MAHIAPLLFSPQTAPQAPVNTANGAGSDLSFGALLEKTVSSGAADAQQSPAKPASPRKIISSQTETAKTGADAPPAQSEPTAITPDAPALDLNAGIDGRSLTLFSPLGSMPEQPRDIKKIQPSLVPDGKTGLNLPPVSGLKIMAAVVAAENLPASPLTSAEPLTGDRQVVSAPAVSAAENMPASPLISAESLTGDRQVVSAPAVSAAPAAAAESEIATPAGFPPRAGIQADPEPISQLPATGRTVMPRDTAWFTLPALSDTPVPAAEPEALITPASSDGTVSALPPRGFTPTVLTDPAAAGVPQSNSTTAEAVAQQRISQPHVSQPRVSQPQVSQPQVSQPLVSVEEESAASPVSLEKSAIPSPVFTSVTGTEPDSTGIAGLQQTPATGDIGIWLPGGHIFGKTTISSGYSVTIEATTPPAATGRQSAISAQLQELITSNETGNLTITPQTAHGDPLEHLARLTPSLQISPLAAGAADSAQIVAPQTEMTPLIASFNQLTSLKTPVDQSTEKASPAQQESLRQEVKGQFIEAKIETRDKGADNQGQQPDRQNMATDAKLFATPLAASGTSDQTTAFFQLNQAITAQALPQPAAAAPAPVAPPPGAPVADDFIFNQVAERFQLHTRNQETQLHIKLNPAELGELKIDLTMKDGSIRAHIVAQSGQVQEVLEKNMVRLKSILEGQGFTIEEILVSIKAEDTGSFGPQQDQLSRGNTAGQRSRQQKETSFDDTYDRVVAAAAGPATGVNITA